MIFKRIRLTGRWRIALALAGVLVCCASVGNAQPAVRSQVAPHLAAARELAAQVSSANNSYEHKAGTILWKGVDGAKEYECHTDCSGLLNHLFERCYGLTDDDFRNWLGRKRPMAKTYYEAIAEANGFEHIARLDRVRPGDLIAVKYPADSDNTGHIMIVERSPALRTATAPQRTGTMQWEVAVLDCTSSGHGKQDSRYISKGRSRSGVGSGVIRLYTNRSGDVVGHTWSTSSKSEFRGERDFHVNIGRLAR